MKNHRILLIIIGIVAFLFVASIIYYVLNDHDPYENHSGLGATLSVSPDDAWVMFSSYESGREAIYKGSLINEKVEKVTEPEGQDHRMPQFSPDGEGILYLAANNSGIQSLHYWNVETGEEPMQLTGLDAHISDAAFSPDGRTIYYIAIPAVDFLKPEGEKENGADLFSIAAEGGNPLKLTDKDSFAMDGISVSADGTKLYYTEFDGVQRLMAYSIEAGTDSAYLPEYLKNDLYAPDFSGNNELLAFAAVSEKSKKSGSLYEYELFLMETLTGETKRLTDFQALVTSPSFFHHKNRLAFLKQPNWPDEPAVYEAMTVDFDSGEIADLQLDFAEPKNAFQPSTIARWFTHPIIVPGLYLLLFGLWTAYSHSVLKKRYLPLKISAILTGLVFASSFAAAVFNPWAAIGLFVLSAGLAGCTVIIFAFAYSYRRQWGK